eukprot:228567_1
MSVHVLGVMITVYRMETKDTPLHILISSHVLLCIPSIFYSFWAISAFYSYHNEMTKACKQSSGGSLMIAWSIVLFCCICFAWIYYVDKYSKFKSKGRVFTLTIASMGIMIASIYNQYADDDDIDACAHADYSLYDPSYFTLVGSIITTTHLISIWIFLDYFYEKYDNRMVFVISYVLCLFYLIWTIMGFYIFAKDMSSDCKQSAIGLLMIAWSVVAFIVAFIVSFAVQLCLHALALNNNVCAFNVVYMFVMDCFYFVSIAAMVIGAAAYGSDEGLLCKNDNYLFTMMDMGDYMDMGLFTMILGVISTVHIAYRLLFVYCYDKDDDNPLVTCLMPSICVALEVILTLFYFIWCIIGLYIMERMTESCNTSELGVIMRALCTIQFIASCISICLVALVTISKRIRDSVYRIFLNIVAQRRMEREQQEAMKQMQQQQQQITSRFFLHKRI